MAQKTQMPAKQFLIIGNGVAAAACIEGIRSTDNTADITVLSAEKHPVYCRPLISYYLQKKTPLQNMGYRPADFYQTHNCTVRYGVCATSIDAAKKTVTLSDNKSLSYDALCVATGSSPFIPAVDGYQSVQCKFTFMTLDDALSIEQAITQNSRVLIVGAGLIGLKCAEGLYGRVQSITVCDLAERVLSSVLDAEAAAIVQAHLKEKGILFHLGDTVEHFEGNRAVLRSGTHIHFDVLVMAVGVRANTALVRNAGGNCGRGIRIDACGRTSLENVYAAGDCTESIDISDGTEKVMALLPNAYQQGFCAGVNMAKGTAVFDCAIPMNSIGFFGLHTMSAGCRTQEYECYAVHDKNTLKKLYMRENRLIGFELVGATEHAGIYTDLIRKKTSLDSLDFESLKKYANFSAFDANYRRNCLGSVV